MPRPVFLAFSWCVVLPFMTVVVLPAFLAYGVLHCCKRRREQNVWRAIWSDWRTTMTDYWEFATMHPDRWGF